MCDERERLIEYIYGESETLDRQQMEAHLEGCHVCRAEVSGLRGVRDDLLAWEVPKHEAIWRPFVPAPVPVVPLWRRMPAWGLAAAATVLFAAGAAGGMATRMWMPGPADSAASVAVRQTVAAGQAQIAQPQTVPVSVEDLAQLEASILQLRGEMERLQMAVANPSPQQPARTTLVSSHSDVEDRVSAIERWMDDQIMLNVVFNGQFGRLNRQTSSLSEQVELSRMQRVSLEGGR